MTKYQAVKEQHYHPDIGTYMAWGIKGWQTSGRERTGTVYIPDVFLCEKDAEDFAALCTRLNVSLSHLSDLVEDYLTGGWIAPNSE